MTMISAPYWTPRRRRMYLQMAIYYKGWFSLLFHPISLLLLVEKLSDFPYAASLTRTLHVSAFVLLLLSDFTRYWLGMHGNLRQQVFHLTAFVFLSICPMIPALIYFSFFSEHRVAFDHVAGGFMMTFVVLETLLALLVVRELLRQETTRFVRLREVVRQQEKKAESSSSHIQTAQAC